MRTRSQETDTGWVGAGPDDDLHRRLEAEEVPFDPTRPHVRSLLGPIDPGALGPTLMGEPLDLAARSLERRGPAVGGREVLLAELEDAYAGGIRAIVALCRTDAALDDLIWLAGRVPLHLVAACPPGLVEQDTDQRIGALVLDLDDTDSPASLAIERVEAVHRARSLPVSVRVDHPAEAGEAVDALRLRGVAADRLWVGGCDWADGGNVPVSLLRAGISVAFDTLYRVRDTARPGTQSGAQVAKLAGLARAGNADRLLLGSGIDDSSGYRVGGGPGVAAVLESVPIELMDDGVEALAIRAMMVEAPARLLTIRAGVA